MRKRNKMGWFTHYMASSYLQVSINVFTGLENQALKYSVWEAEDSILFLRCGNRCDVSGPCGGPANRGGCSGSRSFLARGLPKLKVHGKH